MKSSPIRPPPLEKWLMNSSKNLKILKHFENRKGHGIETSNTFPKAC